MLHKCWLGLGAGPYLCKNMNVELASKVKVRSCISKRKLPKDMSDESKGDE